MTDEVSTWIDRVVTAGAAIVGVNGIKWFREWSRSRRQTRLDDAKMHVQETKTAGEIANDRIDVLFERYDADMARKDAEISELRGAVKTLTSQNMALAVKVATLSALLKTEPPTGDLFDTIVHDTLRGDPDMQVPTVRVKHPSGRGFMTINASEHDEATHGPVLRDRVEVRDEPEDEGEETPAPSPSSTGTPPASSPDSPRVKRPRRNAQ